MAGTPGTRLLNAMRAWEDFGTYPTGDRRRFTLAYVLLEEACRRLPSPVTLVTSDVRGDSGDAAFGRTGWAFFLTVGVWKGKVCASLDQLRLEDGIVGGLPGSGKALPRGPSLLEAREQLGRELARRVSAAQDLMLTDPRRRWFGELVESWPGMWRDQTFVVLDEFLNPHRGLLWANMPPRPEWRTPRMAWLAYNGPLRNRIGGDGASMEQWELPDDHPYKEHDLAGSMFVGRKWPDQALDRQIQYTSEELNQSLRLLRAAKESPLRMEPQSIAMEALARLPGTLQQRVFYHLIYEANVPALQIAKALGFSNPRDVRKAAKQCAAKLRGQRQEA